MENSGRYHLNEIIKVKNIGANQQHTSPHKAQKGLNTTSVGFLPKAHHLNLIMIKHLSKPKLRAILQNNWPINLKSFKS